MARELTKARKGFVKDYAETGIGSLAVKRNYKVKNENTARAMASELLTFPNVQKALADRIPDDLLEERHIELLNKREIHRIGQGENEEWEISDQPDTQAVSKALDMAYKLKGSYAPEKQTRLELNVEGRLEDKSETEALRIEYEEKLKAKLLI